MANRMVNSSRFGKYATIMITKQLQAIADNTATNVRKDVANKLKESYKRNIKLSYTPRSAEGWETLTYNEDPYRVHKKKLTYHHTNTLYDSVDTVIEGNYVKVKLKPKTYNKGAGHTATVEQVHKWLTEGTKGKNENYVYTDKYLSSGGRNYPTEKHHFEEWTKLEMRGYLDSLISDVERGKYTN